MRIGNNLRDLLMGQEETVMLSRTKCDYLGEKYHFNRVTWDDQIKRIVLIAKFVNQKSWLQKLFDKI